MPYVSGVGFAEAESAAPNFVENYLELPYVVRLLDRSEGSCSHMLE